MEGRRATFAPAGRLHPVPDDVLVTEVSAGGVPAHWLAAPGTGTGRVLLFLHGGGYGLGSLRSDGELAARQIGKFRRPGSADQTARRRKPFPAPSPSPGYLTPGELRRGVWPSGRFITFSRLSIGSAA